MQSPSTFSCLPGNWSNLGGILNYTYTRIAGIADLRTNVLDP